MTKQVVVLVALCVFQGVFAGVPHRCIKTTDVNKIGEYTRNLIEKLKTDYDVEQLRYFKKSVEKLVDLLEAESDNDDAILELKNKLGDVLATLDDPHRLGKNLDAVWRILKELTSGERPVLTEVVDEYSNALERACAVGFTASGKNVKEEAKVVLEEVIENLKSVSWDNKHVKTIMMTLIRNYIKALEQFHDDLQDEVDCFKKLNDKDLDSKAFKKCLEKLLVVVKKGHLDENVLDRLLQATRTLEFNMYVMCQTKVPLGETPLGFEVQIQTVASGLINAINTIDVESDGARRILGDLVREFVSEITRINEQLRTKIDIEGLKHTKDMDVDKIKAALVKAVQESTLEINSVLRHHRHLGKDVYGIVSDFLAILQRQTMQVQNIFQSTADKLPVEKLAAQVQTITNSVLLYLRNVPTNDVMIREKLEVQVHHLVKRLLGALKRVKSRSENDDLTKAISKIKDIADDFESFMEKTHITSIPEVVFHFDILAQKVASGMKQLAWIVKKKEALSAPIRSLLSEYLIIIENIQVKIQRINQVAQVGESPRELALQIQVTSEHLRKLLAVFATDNHLTKNMLMWQLRCLNQVLEVIIEQLESKTTTKTGKNYHDVAQRLKKIQKSLSTHLNDSPNSQFRTIIGNIIRRASMELTKLTTTSHSNLQEGHGIQTTFVRSLLLEYLLELQDFHMQVQYNFQIVLSGQSPMAILREIGTITNKILGLIEGADVNMEEVLAIQLGEYVQTIENVLNLLHHRMKNNGEHETEQEKISDMLGKMSLILQHVNLKDVRDVREKLEMAMRKFMTVMQELVSMNMDKVKQMQAGTHTGILHSALSNMLGTMRNMYVQMQYAKRMPNCNKTNEVLNQITSIGNNIMPALETIVGSTTPIKQALNLQVFKYARELKVLSKKLNTQTDSKIKDKIVVALMALEQTASSIATLTINELKLHLNKVVQGVGNEIQKLNDQNILIEYLMALKSLHLQVQRISRMSHQSENYQLVGMMIDSAVIELCRSLQNAPDNKVIAKALVLESHELAQLIGNVIMRYQAAAIAQKNKFFMNIASELRTIQLQLQEMTVKNMSEQFDRHTVEMVASVERGAILIEELMWMPVAQTTSGQYKPDIPTFIRVTLHDFLTAVQNMVIQVESVLVHVTDDKLTLVDKLSHESPDNVMETYESFKKSLGKLDRNAIKKYAKQLLALVEEIMKTEPKDPVAKIFVQKMHLVYTSLRGMLLDHINVDSTQMQTDFLECVRKIALAFRDFHHNLNSESTDKHLLVLAKNWLGEFCKVLNQHDDRNVDGSMILSHIKMLTSKIVNKLRKKNEEEVLGYVHNYFKALRKMLEHEPDSLVGDLKQLFTHNDEGTKNSFINALQMFSNKLEAIAKNHDDKLLKNYLECLERMYGDLSATYVYHMY